MLTMYALSGERHFKQKKNRNRIERVKKEIPLPYCCCSVCTKMTKWPYKTFLYFQSGSKLCLRWWLQKLLGRWWWGLSLTLHYGYDETVPRGTALENVCKCCNILFCTLFSRVFKLLLPVEPHKVVDSTDCIRNFAKIKCVVLVFPVLELPSRALQIGPFIFLPLDFIVELFRNSKWKSIG